MAQGKAFSLVWGRWAPARAPGMSGKIWKIDLTTASEGCWWGGAQEKLLAREFYFSCWSLVHEIAHFFRVLLLKMWRVEVVFLMHLSALPSHADITRYKEDLSLARGTIRDKNKYGSPFVTSRCFYIFYKLTCCSAQFSKSKYGTFKTFYFSSWTGALEQPHITQ